MNSTNTLRNTSIPSRPSRMAPVMMCLALIFSPTADAQKVHKWVDEDGVTHYGDRPPQNTETQVIRTKSAASSDGQAAERLNNTRERLREDIKARAEAAKPPSDEEQERAEQIQKNCEIAKKNLTVLQQNNQVKETKEDGEVRMLPEEERQAKISESQKYLSEHCP